MMMAKQRVRFVDGFLGEGIPIKVRSPSGFSICPQVPSIRRIRLVCKVKHASDYVGEDSDRHEFGRDTNRVDYFKVTAFDLHGDDQFTGIASHGGGGGGRLDPVGISANNGSEAVFQRLEQHRVDGGGGGSRISRRLSIDRRSEQVSGRTREVAIGGFGNNSGGGGEDVGQRIKQLEATVAVPMVVVAVIVVLVSIMVKSEILVVDGRWK
ncbi:hypothetical protein LXL04_016844 [Taraxacum kok-saghyz]